MRKDGEPTGVSVQRIHKHYEMGLYTRKPRPSSQRDIDHASEPTYPTQASGSFAQRLKRLNELGVLKPKNQKP